MSGVAIANQLMFVFYLAVFGGLAGAGIFAAQFFGAGDNEGLRYTLRYKLWASAVILAVALAVFLSGGDWLISLFLKGEGDPSEAAAILEYGRVYLRIMLWGLLPFILSQVYGSTLREIGDTMVPMVASVAAVLTNLCFNWVLIFGKLGFLKWELQVLPLQRLYPICGTGDHSCVYPYEYCTVWVRGWGLPLHESSERPCTDNINKACRCWLMKFCGQSECQH